MLPFLRSRGVSGAMSAAAVRLVRSTVASLTLAVLPFVATQAWAVDPPAISAFFNVGGFPTNTQLSLNGTVTIVVFLTNPSGNSGSQTGIGLTVNLPAGLVAAGTGSNSCAGTLSATPGSATVTLTGGSTLNPADQCTLAFDIRGSAIGSYTFSLTPTATNTANGTALSLSATVINPLVNTTDDVDDGVCDLTHCSLREAINAANASTTIDDTIGFAIPGTGPHTIQLASVLPAITDTVTIDGLTQPANGGASASCTAGPLLVEIVAPPNPTPNSTISGLVLSTTGANGSTIRGLAISGFHTGDSFSSGISLYGASSSRIQCNFLGTNPAGTASANGGNRLGVRSNVGTGNIIGTDGDGTNDANERNVASGNEDFGVYLDTSSSNKVAGNFIGTDVTGANAVPNAFGVAVIFGASNNVIGFDGAGTESVEGNLIAFNGNDGIVMVGNTDTVGNRVSANRFMANGAGHGIDLKDDSQAPGVTANDAGDTDTAAANNFQNFPVITAASVGVVNTATFTLDTNAGNYRVEFFSSPACAGTNGQGQVYLGAFNVTVPSASNTVALPPTVTANHVLTATAIKLSGSGGTVGDTSEFSACAIIQGPPALSGLATSPNPSLAGGLMTLTGTATDPNTGDTLTLTVDWGDGSPNSIGTVPNGTPFSRPHTYAALGIFTVTVTVSDGVRTATQTLTQVVLGAPQMTMAFTPNSIPLNGTSTLTFVISNFNTTTALTGVQFTDPFPPGLKVAATPNASATGCGAASFAPSAGATTLTFSGATVAASSTCTVKVDVTATQPGIFTNFSGAVSSINAGTGNAPASSIQVLAADLSITKTDNRVAAIAGQSVTYVIKATNAGPDIAIGALVSDTFAAMLTCSWTCSATSGGSCGQPAGAGDISRSVNLAVGSSVTFTATCTLSASATGPLENTATVTAPATTPDPNTQNNSAKDTDTVLVPSLSLTKTSSATSFAQAGDVLPFTMVATNDGSLLLTNVSITDPLLGALTCTSTGVPAAGQPVALDPGETLTCTGNHVVTGADVVAGFVTNTASASGAFDDATGVGNLQVAQAEALVTVTVNATVTVPGIAPAITAPRVAFTTCNLELQQDWQPRYTKLQFEVWNEDEVKFTGAFECADSWHETDFGPSIDSAAQNFTIGVLGTFGARYRVQAVTSTQCPDARATGLLGVQSMLAGPNAKAIGSTLAGAGKFTGSIRWDPAGAVPEGRR